MKKTLPKLTEIMHLNEWIYLVPFEWREAYEEAHDLYLSRVDFLKRKRREEIYRSSTPEDFGITQEEARKMRRRFVKQQVSLIEEALQANRKAYVDTARRCGENSFEAFLLIEEAQELLKQLSKYEGELRFRFMEGGINQEMIEKARSYPITNIIKIDTQGFAPCIAHNEKTPSMYTRNNFAYCFGCGYHGDSIAVFMLIHSVSFPEAVKSLQ